MVNAAAGSAHRTTLAWPHGELMRRVLKGTHVPRPADVFLACPSLDYTPRLGRRYGAGGWTETSVAL